MATLVTTSGGPAASEGVLVKTASGPVVPGATFVKTASGPVKIWPPDPVTTSNVFGALGPIEGADLSIGTDGGGSLRLGHRFYITSPRTSLTVRGMRLWNPASADSTFLNTDVTCYAYNGGDWQGVDSLSTLIADLGAPLATKAHTAARVAGTWTDVLFDAPVTLDRAISSSPDGNDTILMAYEFAGGNYYMHLTTPGTDQWRADVFASGSRIANEVGCGRASDSAMWLAEPTLFRSAGSISLSSGFYGIDIIHD